MQYQEQTIKVQIFPTVEQQKSLFKTMRSFRDACDWLSKHAFEDGCYNAHELQKRYYPSMRVKSNLKAQMAVTVTRVVAGTYDTINALLKAHPWEYEDEDAQKTYRFKRNVSWLQQPANFKKYQLALVRERDWCFKKNNTISLNTSDGRIEVPYQHYAGPNLLSDDVKYGTSRVVYKNKKWYFHLTTKAEVDDVDDITNIVGMDRGIVNMYCAFDSNGEIKCKSGDEIQAKRDKFQRTRSSLQKKGTKGARRTLKRISGRENRWMNDVNHCETKTLVREYGPGTMFVLEDLVDVSFESNNRGKEANRNLHSWSFYDFALKLTYKATLNGSTVAYVNARYTSQRCPQCGNIDSKARNRDKHLYTCKCCGFTANDDLVGAMNIYQLGARLRNGEDNPHYVKPKQK